MKALVLGLFDNDSKSGTLQNVPTTQFSKHDALANGQLKEQVDLLGPLKHKQTRIILKALTDYPVIVVVGLGSSEAEFNEQEDLHEKQDNIRKAIASAIRSLRELDHQFDEVLLDSCDDAESVAISAIVSDWTFDELKSEKLQRKPFIFNLIDKSNQRDVDAWSRGFCIANMQNVCRRLQELPSNILTPTRFSIECQQLCEPLGIKVVVHDRKWAEEKKMNAFLSVNNGSQDEPCKFVELHYMNAGEKRPFVFCGKGITFDTGGVSIKPSSQMDLQRADMGGAATVLCTIAALAKLQSKVNVIGLLPMTANAVDSKATRPGDVVRALNGKTIQIDNTDAEGRLVLADALCYADTFDPELVASIATLTGASKIAMGQVAACAFSTNNKYWEALKESGQETGERLWRFPLYKDYGQLVKNAPSADLSNTSKDSGFGAGTILAAMFLKEFTKSKNWMHIDMSCVKHTNNSSITLGKGMTGRPLRSMIHFCQKIFM